jgi:hypothetical protein
VVDGYVSSKRKYTTTEPAPNNDFLSRVYASRVSDEHLNSIKPEPACLPDQVDKEELVDALIDKIDDSELPINELLYKELISRYAC